MSDRVMQPLCEELDRWSAARRRLGVWLRDDDAVADTPALRRLAALARRFDAPVLLAVIPMLAEPSLAAILRDTPLLLPCQHGCAHRNHAPQGTKKSEFGANRSAAEIELEIAEARRRLRDLLGDAVLPIFVPPWNRIDPGHAALLPEWGFSGLSCFRTFALGTGDGPLLANSEIDVMDWHGGRVGRQPDALVAEICGLLAAKRLAPMGDDDTLGLLLHHRDHDETAWDGLDLLLRRVAEHPAASMIDPRRLFGGLAGI